MTQIPGEQDVHSRFRSDFSKTPGDCNMSVERSFTLSMSHSVHSCLCAWRYDPNSWRTRCSQPVQIGFLKNPGRLQHERGALIHTFDVAQRPLMPVRMEI